jgi:Domain of unknown function (DUF4157)
VVLAATKVADYFSISQSNSERKKNNFEMKRSYYPTSVSQIQKKPETAFFDHNREEKQPFFAGKDAEGQGNFFNPAQLSKDSKPSVSSRPTIQAKLSIGQPNDKYEQEADTMADKVVQRFSQSGTIQRSTPPVEEEKIQKMDAEKRPEEMPELQKSPVSPVGEEEKMQMKCMDCEEKDKPVQRKANGETTASPSIESRLSSTKGSGSPLANDTRSGMESAFGADFSGVRVHTGSEAVQMSQDLNAHAFTHGSDVYFNSGKYNPSNTEGSKLLAHELTHTVQQGNQLRRDPLPAAPTTATPTPVQSTDPILAAQTVDESSIFTHQDFALWFAWRKVLLISHRTELEREGLGVPESMDSAIETAQTNIDLNQNGGEDPVSIGQISDAKSFTTTYRRAIETGRKLIANRVKADLEETQRVANESLASLEGTIMPNLQDELNTAFMAEDESKIGDIADLIGTVLDTALELKDLTATTHEVVTEVIGLASYNRSHLDMVTTKIPAVVQIAEKVNKAYAAFQLVRDGLAFVRGGHRTESARGRAGVNLMVTVFDAGGTLLGASTACSVYANFYLGPMTKAALDMLTKIEDMIRKKDREAIEMGELDLVHWGVQPGGRPMFDFMLRVMHAESSEDMPTISNSIEEYLMGSRSGFNAGVGAADNESREMPTNGWIFKDLDKAKAKRWIFNNRQHIWAMLYGSAKVPDSIH